MDIIEVIKAIWVFIKTIWANSPTFFPAAVGALIAVFSIRTQRKTSKEKNSLDFEAAYKRNEKVVEAWSEVLRIYADRGNVPLEEWGKPENSQSDGSKALKIIFNEWERCANAVHHKLYDEEYLYKVYGSTLIFLDVCFEPYIQECWKKNHRFYRNMKMLALRWRVRRAYEDDDGDLIEYKKVLKEAKACVDKLKIRY
ncbi:DUF4760 domain-containing protein [Serratia grimesii]|uniref:DUF4760 domain-containing protein n=1 Tax=Serratia grimesii TaxID=82995 RepID=UPI001EE2DC31|nr:DUF4760 domain-containing protein [Serratia grimesii]